MKRAKTRSHQARDADARRDGDLIGDEIVRSRQGPWSVHHIHRQISPMAAILYSLRGSRGTRTDDPKRRGEITLSQSLSDLVQYV